MNNHNEPDFILMLCFAGVGLLGFGIADFFDVPFLEAIKILPKLLVWGVGDAANLLI